MQLPSSYRLNEFTIDQTLGAGGFGITYLATDTNLDRKVAVKEYFPNTLATRDATGAVSRYADNQETVEDFNWGLSRFLDEAKTLAKFEHPNIIRVSRYFEANDTAYIVMDFADGRTLSSIIKEHGFISQQDTIGIIAPILQGLRQVHAEKLLHRDIKPQNIIIRPDGSPVLIDFGAARQAIEASQSISTIITPGYAPIEQYSLRSNQGPWTDIYSLGAVAYYCITGEAPAEATRRFKDDPLVPIQDVARTEVNDAFCKAITWALDPDGEKRPKSVMEYYDVLKKIPPIESDTPAPMLKPEWQKLALPIGAGVLVIALLASFFVMFSSDQASKKQIADNQTQKTNAGIDANSKRTTVVTSRPGLTSQSTRNGANTYELLKTDRDDFSAAKYIGTYSAYKIYVEKHPNGTYIDEARNTLYRLQR